MHRKHYLLPHSFQRIGWALLICVPILLVLVPWVFNDLKLIPQHYSRFGTMLLEIVATFAALFVGLSEEKQEDEFIQSLRLRSVALTAYICFVLMILSITSFNIIAAFRLAGNVIEFYRLFSTIIFAFFVYIIIFRYRLYKYRKEASHEE